MGKTRRKTRVVDRNYWWVPESEVKRAGRDGQGKGWGTEYWSARPGNMGGSGNIGRFTKEQTHRAERREGKRQTRDCD